MIPGRLFGQGGNLRVCKPCENIIHGKRDDSSDYSEDGDRSDNFDVEHENDSDGQEHSQHDRPDHTKMGTPMMGIPVSRKAGNEKKRRSAVIEFDGHAGLTRPSSSRSLRSLTSRPRSSSHKRHQSRTQHFRRHHDEHAPFHAHIDSPKANPLPAFHHDSIIDPDLAPFLSDEGSSEDEQVSIFATISGDGRDQHDDGANDLLAPMKKGRSRIDERSIGLPSHEFDNMSMASRHMYRHNRRRNLSVGSVAHGRPSPRRAKSNSLLKNFTLALGSHEKEAPSPIQYGPIGGSRMTRSASMRGDTAPAIELNRISLQHVRRMLKQMLGDSRIPQAHHWEKALVPILLQCTDDVNPDVQRSDDIDIRNYIKLKKIPGGRPGDTCYVSGVVFSKNVALKSMARNISNPRIIIVTFAIEYARHHQHFMSLEPVIAQEREYLRNLVNRIAALDPQVLLVQRNVSGLALRFLEEANISVVYNVKDSVLKAVARCTQTRMVSSVDKLAIDPAQLGRSASFDVKTYVNYGVKKSYVFITGCQPDLGCTIVLRGAGTESLRKVKRICEFMAFIVYNLKLETCLMRDEFVSIPTHIERNKPAGSDGPPAKHGRSPSTSAPARSRSVQEQTNGSHDAEKLAMQSQATPGIDQFGVGADGDAHAPASHDSPERPSVDVLQRKGEDHTSSYYGDMVEKHESKVLSASPFVSFPQPYQLMKARDQEKRLEQLKRLRDQYAPATEEEEEEKPGKFELVRSEMVHSVATQASKQVRDFLHAVHAAEYDKAMHSYQTQKRNWENYLSSNAHLFDPLVHQKIAVLYSVVNTITSNPCIGPDIIALGFYNQYALEDGFAADCTIGQYVEDLCTTGGQHCHANGCDKKMYDHHRQYVHGEGQMSVIVQKYPAKIRGLHNTILMWSCCRICGQETQVIPMSENTWKYSFGKYLELTFWGKGLHPRADVCPHDIHRDHVRYFGLNNVALRIQYDSVELYEVITPRATVTWKVDNDLKTKNEQFLRIEDRLDKFMISVKARLHGIHPESVAPERADFCKAELEALMRRANEEHDWLRRKLQDKYLSSRYYEIIPLNRAIRAIQEKAIGWDETFAEFERQFFPSEKDIRRLAALQLKKLFLERDESTTSIPSIEESLEEHSSDHEKAMLNEKALLDAEALTPRPSKMSPEKAQQMMSSVVEEDRSKEVDYFSEHTTPVKLQETPADPSESLSLPMNTPLHALEREDVRHLDLAVSSNFPDNQSPRHSISSQPKTSHPGTSKSPAPSSERTSPDPVPLDRTINEAVDKMQDRPQEQQTPAQPMTIESRIPRLVDSKSSPKPHPLPRAYSQPSGVSLHKHNNSTTSTTSTNDGLSDLSTTDASSEAPRASLTEAARALEKRMAERLTGAFKPGRSAQGSMIPRSIPKKHVSTLAKHFEQLSREFEQQRMRERALRVERSRQARAYPLAQSNPVVEVYNDAHEAVQEPSSDEEVHSLPQRTSTDTSGFNNGMGDSTVTETTITTTEPTTASDSPTEDRHQRPSEGSETRPDASQHASDVEDIDQVLEELDIGSVDSSQILSPSDSSGDLSLDLPKHEKISVMKLLSSFWSERSASGWLPLDYPFTPIEHVWADSDIIVREDEPSSIIALALSSPDYLVKMEEFRGPPPGGEKIAEGSKQSLEEASIERNILRPKATNIRYGFGPNRGVRAQCKVFFAENFDAVRRKCGVADRFVESMSRCLKWDSKGGKSKSIFLRTLDDRFVLKSLSGVEVNAFFAFAPNYFDYVHQNLFKSMPSVIAKMFGLFQVVIKNPATGRDFDWYMLVMENLFYDKEPNRRFDLKGSMRNRKIQSTGERDEVLLDENLVDIIFEQPIFVREQTKRLLTSAVYNDTLFLSKQNVMDYSLMAGFDDPSLQIIVGIIDCIRTYTWDKKLETWIKDRGKNKPTITSPRDYRNRFRIAMGSYILQAPDCWHQFGGQDVVRRPLKLAGRKRDDSGDEVVHEIVDEDEVMKRSAAP